MPQTESRRDAVRTRNSLRTKSEILRVATAEFAENGFAGARVEAIAAQTTTTKRMIYYYFESKEVLYLSVLEAAYSVIRQLERDLVVDELDPFDALRSLAESTYEHHTTHRDFVRLVAIENVHRAAHLASSESIRDVNATAVATFHRVVERGVSAGEFRSDVDALDLHMLISAYSIFPVASGDTFREIFGRDLLDEERHAFYRRFAGDVAVRTMALDDPTATLSAGNIRRVTAAD